MKSFSISLFLITFIACNVMAQPATGTQRPENAPQNQDEMRHPGPSPGQPYEAGNRHGQENRGYGDNDDRDQDGMRDESRCGWNQHGKSRRFCLILFLLFMAVVHLLLTIIVAKDLSKSGASILWVFVALLAGLPGAAVYALFRIGDSVARNRSTE